MRKFRALFLAVVSGWQFHAQAAEGTNAISQVAGQRYKVAVCDWMILKRQKLGEFQLAKDLGADGVELDMGSLGTNETFLNTLTNEANCWLFLEKVHGLNLEISSLSMSGFYGQSFADRATVPRMTQDCMDTMRAMDVKVAFLPLGVSDLLKHPELRSKVVERLKIAGAQAEKAEVVIGVESELPAVEQIKLLDEVDSPAIKICFNFADAIQNNRDLIAELKTLGADRICEIHATDQDGAWLQNDPHIDLPQVKAALDHMNWRGWLVIERSRDTNDVHNVRKNYGANAVYLKKIFQP
ncbi:MAG TPA: sugar phosphate isomerase/epimerase family protein [Candidatus Sulfotelmatobacter sp.]|jgi:L-ribulose-5-phosphate 3-epimerase|nr:sugar phosphate isomerase/epimerase family protein [Candidatus Sulfotelmatobacter sp.]